MYTILGVHTIITGQKNSILFKQKVTHQKFEHVSFVWQIIYGTFSICDLRKMKMPLKKRRIKNVKILINAAPSIGKLGI